MKTKKQIQNEKSRTRSQIQTVVRKFFLSAFVVGSFVAYAIENHAAAAVASATTGSVTSPAVQFLQYPNERSTSVRINSFADPQLEQEAIQAQSANVNIVTGATLTSEGFQQSLQATLGQAKG